MIPLDAREVKQHADFLTIVFRYTQLRRAGRQYVGLCPFHWERHPSFYVEPERKIWKCFGCGAGGDVFAFVMRAESCDFARAVEIVSKVVSDRGPAVFAGPRERGPAVFAGPPQIVRKRPEPSRFHNALLGAEPELPGGCEAERAAIYNVSE